MQNNVDIVELSKKLFNVYIEALKLPNQQAASKNWDELGVLEQAAWLKVAIAASSNSETKAQQQLPKNNTQIVAVYAAQMDNPFNNRPGFRYAAPVDEEI